MPDAAELFGGFWGSSAPSPVIDDLAAALTILSDGVVGQAAVARTSTFVIRRDQMTIETAPNGRRVASYPAPSGSVVWISAASEGSVPILCYGTDFDIVDGRVRFDTDPLTVYPLRSTWVDGVQVDTLTLWYGRPPAPPKAPDPGAATYAALVTAVATATDSPAALGTETVEAVFTTPLGTSVVTGERVYQLGPDDAATVTVGAALRLGTPVGSAWTLTKLGSNKPVLPHLTTPASFNQGATTGGITWYDEAVALVVDVVATRTRVRFALGATSQGDLNAFWAAAQANGVANGRTLAQALDTRTNPTNDPDASSLPLFVNPLELVCRELLAGNAWLLVLYPDRYGPSPVTAAARTAAIRTAAGPYVAVFTYENEVPALTAYNPS